MRAARSAGFWGPHPRRSRIRLRLFGPIVFSPEANQGPLLGIFISGPGGALLGAILGLIVGFLPLTARAALSLLVSAAIAVAGVTLYFSMPSPRLRATIVDVELRGCDPPELRSRKRRCSTGTIGSPRSPRAKPREGWKEDVDRMLRETQGVVLTMHVVRRGSIYEHQKPWNKGSLFARPWKPEDAEQRYFAQAWGTTCDQYEPGKRGLYLAKGESAQQWPPRCCRTPGPAISSARSRRVSPLLLNERFATLPRHATRRTLAAGNFSSICLWRRQRLTADSTASSDAVTMFT